MCSTEASNNFIELDVQEEPGTLLKDSVAHKDDTNKAQDDKPIDLMESVGLINEVEVQCEQQDHEPETDQMTPEVNAEMSDQGDGMRDTDIETLTNYPGIRRSELHTAGQPFIRFGYEQSQLVLETSTESERIPASYEDAF